MLVKKREMWCGKTQNWGRGHHRVPGSQELVGWFMGLLGFRRQVLFSQRRKYHSWNYTSSQTFLILPFLLIPPVKEWTRGTAKLYFHLSSFSPSRPHSHFPFSCTMRPPFPQLSFPQSVLTQSERVSIRPCSFQGKRYRPCWPSGLIERPV